MPFRDTPIWLLPNLLSLDAPLVALVWQAYVSNSFGVPLTWSARAALALAVWAVYIADRLLDASGISSGGESSRHVFYRRHRRAMSILLTGVLTAGAADVWFLRPTLVRDGIETGGAVLVYLLLVHGRRLRLRAPKELAVALLFTIGTVLAAWSRAARHAQLAIAAAALFLPFWANIVAIEYFEWVRLRRRIAPPPHAITQTYGGRFIRFSVLFLALCLAGVLVAGGGVARIAAAAALALAGLVTLHRCRRHLRADTYRVLADAALLSPVPLALCRRFF
ncbi:MAG TPA: hypothetical protein VG675_08610 [Bryobacteraceae bacterium]|nr:hypothetical protein [Bryobacteraceae bacterium]